ncbi:serine hydrolase domain-containing protein [Flavobacterium sp.]|uniref:serine hydrolase domain-containing protein n=1 Tax=Flavobacterium sp. TaxID=239 RepID=UPI00286EAD28|nr:serine hydrolase domain-containing protein [Flavobacterium sp.]
MKKYHSFIICFLCFSIFCFGQNNPNSLEDKSILTIKGKRITFEHLDTFITKQMDSLNIPGLSFAMINNGAIAYAKNYGVKNIDTKEKVDENTIFEVCSVSKPVFAYFILKQANKRKIDLDKPLYQYYTDPKIDTSNDYYKLVTARMVLNHCSGFPNWRKDEDESNTLYFVNKPGEKYGYSGEGYQYLARVLGKILHKTDLELNDYFQKEVVQPFRAKSMNFTWNNSLQQLKAYSHKNGKPTDNSSQGPADWFGAAGSLHCTAKDYAKFLLSVMDSKNKVGKQLLSLNTTLPKEPDSLYRSFGFPYKMTNGKIRYYHTGNNSDTRSYTHFYLKEKFGIVMLSNCDNFFSSKFVHKLFEYLEEEMMY